MTAVPWDIQFCTSTVCLVVPLLCAASGFVVVPVAAVFKTTRSARAESAAVVSVLGIRLSKGKNILN